ncbi:hypothetical protein FHR76_003438 [Rhizobium sp. RAS22]|nr:hypothetical protein [Rhizobium sp. RAS22]
MLSAEWSGMPVRDQFNIKTLATPEWDERMSDE